MQPTQVPDLGEVITPATTLRGAAQYLIGHGWCQGDMFDLADPDRPFPPACGLGGIRMAAFGTADGVELTPGAVEGFDRAVMAFADHLFTCYGEPDPTVSAGGDDRPWPEQIVADWNDAYDRNVSQVVAALNGAADQWDNRHGRPACCGEPMSEKTPSAWVFPGDPVTVERVFHCPLCDRWENVEVTDPGEKDRLFGVVVFGDADEPENTTDCQLCGAPGGYPYCTGTFGGQPSCASAVAQDTTGSTNPDATRTLGGGR